jgi:enoyl-CoA hydratase/3-hydroxyacyl-CoA dehydrogenase
MGSGIAQKIAQSGLGVVLVDTDAGRVEAGFSRIRRTLDQAVERGIFTTARVEEVLSRITGAVDLEAARNAHLVIEAVFEDRQVKSHVFRSLDALCDSRTILATNTSTFRVAELAANTSRPDRFIGLHYFHPAVKNRLLEVVPHAGTSSETLAAALAFAKGHGKTAIVVKDSPGFAVNRFFVPFLNEAARMLGERMADIPTIEAGARAAFGIDRGPFELMNATGVPLAVHATHSLGQALGPFYETCPIITAQVERGRDWDLSGPVDTTRLAEVSDRFLGVCLGIATTLVAEGIATRGDTDLAAKVGLRWEKGPFEIMGELGEERADRLISTWLKNSNAVSGS